MPAKLGPQPGSPISVSRALPWTSRLAWPGSLVWNSGPIPTGPTETMPADPRLARSAETISALTVPEAPRFLTLTLSEVSIVRASVLVVTSRMLNFPTPWLDVLPVARISHCLPPLPVLLKSRPAPTPETGPSITSASCPGEKTVSANVLFEGPLRNVLPETSRVAVGVVVAIPTLPVVLWNILEFPRLLPVVHLGMKLAVPVPVNVPAALIFPLLLAGFEKGTFVEAVPDKDEFEAAPALASGFAGMNADAGLPPRVSASPAFNA